MKLRPCPKCKCKDIKTEDCGYNAFNPGWAECTKCGYKVQVSDCRDSKDIRIEKAWNEAPVDEKLAIERKKSKQLRKQLRDAGIEPLD